LALIESGPEVQSKLNSLVYESFSRVGGDQLLWNLDSRRLRILSYHGLCDDRLAGEPWIPPYFVTQSAFERHLQYLQRNAVVLPLSEAVVRLQDGSLPRNCVSLTFDDGYANNLYLACPLLKKYKMSASVFLSSAYIESGDLLPFLKVRLIRLMAKETTSQLEPLLDYKSNSVDLVLLSAERWWSELKIRLNEDQSRTLRSMTVSEIREADTQLIEFGAHSHTHCILKNESAERRVEEIRTSIAKVRQWTGTSVRLFSYPNGQSGDFNEADKETVRIASIRAAVSGIAGANSRNSDVLALNRYPVTLSHNDAGFRAEVTGFRAALLAARGLLTS
jgi:peptidoglycan/xylan/chitin deacetylase (PgdA/CDA1 family)